MHSRNFVARLCRSAIIAALYTAVTFLFQAISFGAIQFRISEALCLLPVLWVEAIPGLAVGCLLSNLLAGAIPADILFGTLATLIAAILTRFTRKKVWLAASFPVVSNGIIIGLVLTYCYQIPSLWLNMLTVALGEAVVCYAAGIPLVNGLRKLPSLG